MDKEWTVTFPSPQEIKQVAVLCDPGPVKDVYYGSDLNLPSWQVSQIELQGTTPILHHTVPNISSGVSAKVLSVQQFNECKYTAQARIEMERSAGGHGPDWVPPGSDSWCTMGDGPAPNMDTGSSTQDVDTSISKIEIAPFPDHTAADADNMKDALDKATEDALKKEMSAQDAYLWESEQNKFQWPQFNFPNIQLPRFAIAGGLLGWKKKSSKNLFLLKFCLKSIAIFNFFFFAQHFDFELGMLGLSLGASDPPEPFGPIWKPQSCIMQNVLDLAEMGAIPPIGKTSFDFKLFPMPQILWPGYPFEKNNTTITLLTFESFLNLKIKMQQI